MNERVYTHRRLCGLAILLNGTSSRPAQLHSTTALDDRETGAGNEVSVGRADADDTLRRDNTAEAGPDDAQLCDEAEAGELLAAAALWIAVVKSHIATGTGMRAAGCNDEEAEAVSNCVMISDGYEDHRAHCRWYYRDACRR